MVWAISSQASESTPRSSCGLVAKPIVWSPKRGAHQVEDAPGAGIFRERRIGRIGRRAGPAPSGGIEQLRQAEPA